MFSRRAVDRGICSWSRQIKEYEIDICYFYIISTEQSKYWLSPNLELLSNWSDISSRILLLLELALCKCNGRRGLKIKTSIAYADKQEM
jgi:hypothetical protein